MAKAPTRLITVETRGPIAQKSGIVGPLLQPYLEDVRVIARMVVGRVKVREHLENGDTRLLSVKDIPELTAEAPKVLRPNGLQKKELADAQRIIKQNKQETKVEKVEAEKPAVQPTTESTEDVNLAAMTKAERKAYYKEQEALKAANERQEDVVETK